jgi:hypothetical protein
MGADKPDKDLTYRIGDAFTSQVANTFYAIIGLLIPIYSWISGSGQVKNILLIVETLLIVVVVGSQVWLRGAYLRLRRANAKAMSDPAFFQLVRHQFECDLTAGYGDIADGRLRVFATEVLRVTLQLLRTLSEAAGSSKIIRATDLTTNPRLLEKRSEYLAENRRFIIAGGVVKRLFIVWRRDLESDDFAASLLSLIEQHRAIGVQCGIAVRDRLLPKQAIDFVVFGTGAVIIEDQQGDADYTVGRSSVDFKNVAIWIDIFDTLWPVHGVPTPVARLQQYEATVRQLLNENAWDATRVGRALDSVD